jgi:hypothetical protein
MSPTVLRDGPFRLFFFSREEARMHVHVAHPEGEAKFWVDPTSSWPRSSDYRRSWLEMQRRSCDDTRRRSEMPGNATLAAEITHISGHGFWLLLDGEELLVPFTDFPWFRQATIDQLLNVERPTPNHLHWPQLDVDLSVPSIRDPSGFPLVARVRRVSEGA